MQGTTFNEFDYVGVEYPLNRPTDDKEIVDMLSTQFKDGALSLESYLDKSPLITDVGQEVEKLGKLCCNQIQNLCSVVSCYFVHALRTLICEY
ncbi:phage portal protein [Fusibacter sp. 3D3]|uniref:phage portal protein n=1 Tax=Fusibacter sp. 3D3 TaxID=1048380 RepID=UPI0008534A40|nr:phage portal protein [Fusibacter sp. 3D3]